MQSTSSGACSLYKQDKQPLVGEHAFPPMETACESTHVRNQLTVIGTTRGESVYVCKF